MHHAAYGLVEAASVEHISVALTHVLECHESVVLHWSGIAQKVEHIGCGSELYVRYGDHGDALRHGRHVIFHILLHEVADGVVFWCSPSCLAYGRVVVVTSEVWLYVAIVIVVGTRGETEVCAAMHHVVVEAHACIEIFLCLLCGRLGRHLDERFVPVVEPSGIEFRHHVGTHAAVILVYHLAEFVDVVLTVGCRQCTFYHAALEKPRTVGCEHRYVETFVEEYLAYLCTIFLVHLQRYVLAL